uniref:Chromobox 1 n=1 Tax=Schizaphis graminum TaxID=13262 RepID=A0A2S2NZP3_SCHGA
MSGFSKTTVQENRPDDYSAPPQSKDVVDGPEKPPNKKPIVELSDVKEYMTVSSPIEQKYYTDSTTMPPLLGDESTEDVPCSIESEFEDKVSIKDLDLGNETYFYDDKKFQFKILPKKVGFDRGLEPDRIVGTTEDKGKLMFLIAWKNSVDGEADLLEAKEIYEKYPQLAINYFAERAEFVPSAKFNEKKY